MTSLFPQNIHKVKKGLVGKKSNSLPCHKTSQGKDEAKDLTVKSSVKTLERFKWCLLNTCKKTKA